MADSDDPNKKTEENAENGDVNAENETIDQIEDAEIVETNGESVDQGPQPDEADPEGPAPQPEPDESSPPADVPQSAPPRRSPVPLVLGGIVAGALGFGAAQFAGPLGPQAVPDVVQTSLTDHDARLEALNGAISELKSQLEAARPADPQPMIDDAIASLDAKISAAFESANQAIAGVDAALGALDSRVATLEKQPLSGQAGLDGALDAYERELEAVRNELAAQRALSGELTKEVEAAADTARAQIEAAAQNARTVEANAALLRLKAALETGAGYTSALAALEPFDVPAVLSESASAGVATLDDLSTGFAEPARAALAAARTELAGEGNASDRVGAFFRTQFGVRSTIPREGEGPDAILSRAEAALAQGDITAAIAQIGTLPQTAQNAFSEWLQMARQRLDVTQAYDALASQIGAN